MRFFDVPAEAIEEATHVAGNRLLGGTPLDKHSLLFQLHEEGQVFCAKLVHVDLSAELLQHHMR